MNLMEMILNANGGAQVASLGRQFGLNQSQTTSALEQLLPALLGGVQRSTAQQGGIEALLGALSSGNHAQYLEDPDVLQNAAATQEGNGILSHLFGSKEVSRQVASRASAQTGIGADILKQMLPLAATMLMGSLSKQSNNAGLLGAQPANAAPAEGLLGILTPMLDSDRDGSIADDVVGMLGRFLQK
jgi:hypothetical protein